MSGFGRATHCDVVRIDHFRGFAAYWEVPAEHETAERGRWAPGPGAELFRVVVEELGRIPMILEDLGLITPDVEQLRDRLGYPGMKVLQFAFGDDAQGLRAGATRTYRTTTSRTVSSTPAPTTTTRRSAGSGHSARPSSTRFGAISGSTGGMSPGT